MNESRVDVAHGIYHSVKIELVVDSNGMPLGNDRVAVKIVESLLEEDIPSEWIISMRVWHIYRVFLNGANLYDQNQWHIYKAAIQALNCQPKRGIRQFNLELERQEGALPLKKVMKLSTQSINSVSTVNCCKRYSIQLFPCVKIHALRSQFFHEGDQYCKSYRLLDVHRQIHHDTHGNKMITLS